MRRPLFIFLGKYSLGVLVLCLFLSVCSTHAEGPSERPFRVGLILSMTGQAAEYGEAMNHAIQLAIKDNPAGFSRIRFFLEDSRNDAKTAVSALTKLEQADKVNLVYVWGVAPCAAIHPIAEAKKIPTILQCYDREVSRGKHYVIRFMNDSRSYMSRLVDALHEQRKSRIGIILSETPYLEEMYSDFEASLKPKSDYTLLGRYHANENDFRISVSRARTASFDSLIVFLAVGQVGQFFRQAKEQRLNGPFYGTVNFENRREIEAAAGAMEGAMFIGNAVEPDFARRFTADYGVESQLSFSAMAYEFARLVSELFGDGGMVTKEEIIARFSRIGPRSGKAVKRLEMVETEDEGRYFDFPLVLKRVKGLGFEDVASNE